MNEGGSSLAIVSFIDENKEVLCMKCGITWPRTGRT
jgi:hypothetical protein